MVSGSVEYRILRMIGEGAFGAVYEAERKGQGLSRTVALKLLHASVAGQSGIERRFRDEARMLSMVRHRAIVGVEDLIQVDGAWCIVMECVPGADLAQIVGAGPVPPRAALQVAEEIASALHAAWAQAGPDGTPLHLVHRDVKPQNIRVTPQGEVKLLDFGVARADFGDREARTRAVGIGTVIYMAPERFRGEDTPAGDVYALGVTLFEALTGQPPGESAGDPDRTPPGRLLAAQWTWLADELPVVRELLLAMLDPVASSRPTARECARRLADLRIGISGESLEEWAEARLTMPPAPRSTARVNDGEVRRGSATLAVGQTFTHGEPPTPAPRRSRAPVVLAVTGVVGVVLSIAVVVAAFVTMQWSDGPSTPSGSTGRPPDRTSASPPAVAAPEKAVAVPAAPSVHSTPAEATVPAKLAAARTASPASAAAPVVAETPPSGDREVHAAPAKPALGTVRVTGAESAVFEGTAGRFSPGSVPPGHYRATVRFAGGVEIEVEGVDVGVGEIVTLRCSEQFATCATGG